MSKEQALMEWGVIKYRLLPNTSGAVRRHLLREMRSLEKVWQA